MLDAHGIGDDDALARRSDVAAASVGHLEAVAPSPSHAEVCLPAPIGDDPSDWTTWARADETDAQPRSIAEIRRVDEVDDGDHVAASATPVQQQERHDQPAEAQEPEKTQDWRKHGVALDE